MGCQSKIQKATEPAHQTINFPTEVQARSGTMYCEDSPVVDASTLSVKAIMKKLKNVPHFPGRANVEKAFDCNMEKVRANTITEEFKVAKHSLTTGQAQIAKTPIEESSAYKDLPRLIKRVIVKDKNSNVTFDGSVQSVSESVGALSKVVELALVLLELLEDHSPPERGEIQRKLHSIVNSAGKSDMQLTVGAMFEIIGSSSKTAKVMKFINQSVILCAMAFLKSTLTKTYLTKDVRSADGWKIQISFEHADERFNLWANLNEDVCLNDNIPMDSQSIPQLETPTRKSLGRQFFCKKSKVADMERQSLASQCEVHKPYISVSHIRKEQSTDPFGDHSQHFEFMWDVLLRLELETLDLMEVELNIRDLQFDDKAMPKKKSKHLQKVLALRRVV